MIIYSLIYVNKCQEIVYSGILSMAFIKKLSSTMDSRVLIW